MLKDSSKDAIKTIISDSFEKFRSSFIGPQIAKGFIFTLKHPTNQRLGDAYVHANVFNSMRNSIDKNTIAHLESTASNYIDSLKQKATADIIKSVDDRLAEAYSQGKLAGKTTDEYLRSEDGQEILNSIKKVLDEHEEKISKGLELIANVSLYDAQNYGAADAIIDMSKSLGIIDPIVFKIGILDEKRCLAVGSKVELTGGLTKNVEDLSVGDVLRSHKNTSGIQDRSLKLNSIVQSISKSVRPCIKITLEDGDEIVASEDHPILVHFNQIYLFWPIKDIINFPDIDIVNIHNLSTKQKKKSTANIACPIAKNNGYRDFWNFCLDHKNNICSMYLSGVSIKKICKFYKVDSKNQKYISAILKLSGVFLYLKDSNGNRIGKRHPSSRDNHNNKKYMDALVLKNKQKVAIIEQDIIHDIKNGISGIEISKKYNISRCLLSKFLRTVDKETLTTWHKKLKSNGGRATALKLKTDSVFRDRRAKLAREVFMRTTVLGSKPQYELYTRIKSMGYNIKNNHVIGRVRVDMIVDDKIVIEFDGSGHDMAVRMGKITHGQLKKNDYARDKMLRSMGFKVLRINSPKDVVPSIDAADNLIKQITAMDGDFLEVVYED